MLTTSHTETQENQAKRACLSCRRQRRRCDQTLPHCLICTKAGRQCDGYAVDAIRTFVNLNASNVTKTDKKRLLCEAIAKTKEFGINEDQIAVNEVPSNWPTCSFQEVAQLRREKLVSLPVDYPQQVATLWRSFVLGYCQTNDYWPPGCSVLMLRNKVLDLSMIALSAERLAINTGNADLHIMSLTAYNDSIGLYTSTMEHYPNDKLAAMLAVTSTVYALADGCLDPPEDMANLHWGRSGHFDGALALMQKSGPDHFSRDGFHLVFKKIREMGFFLALTRRQKTFLSKSEWMSSPWTFKPKTWRDRLYDLALPLSDLVVGVEDEINSADWLLVTRERIGKAMEFEAGLARWQSLWLVEAYPHQQISCCCQSLAPFSCICSVPVLEFPSSDFALLQVEFWSLQLLISTTLSRLLSSEAGVTTSWSAVLPTRSSQIASSIEAASALPSLRSTLDPSSGITEGFCRNIFPFWMLRQYRSKNR